MKKSLYFTISMLLILIITESNAQNVALDFDGTNDYVQTDYSGVTGNGARTIEAWIKTTANFIPTASGVQGVIVDQGTFSTGQRFTFNVLWSNAIRIEVSGSGVSGTVAVNDGLWHHVAATYDPSASTNKIKLYVDGVLDTQGDLTVGVNTGTSNDVMIGRRVDGVNHFDGTIDEVRYYNTVLNPTQIAANMNAEFCTNPSSLTGYWKLNEGSAGASNTGMTTATDYSGNDNDGTLSGFSLSGSSSNWVAGPTITLQGEGSTIDTVNCTSYTSPSGTYTWTVSGSYTDTLTSYSGCDSIITIHLTIGTESNTVNMTACESFTSDANNTYITSGTYTEIYTNSYGCDSVVTLNLTIANAATSSMTESACDTYTSPSGETYTSSGTYTENLETTDGCDSTVTLNLTIYNSTSSSMTESACGSYTSPSGETYTSSGTYTEDLQTVNGCDSTLTINLTINDAVETSNTINACDSAFVNGNWYTASETVIIAGTAANGCDSTSTIIVNVTSIDATVTNDNGTLSANETNADSYTWIDCATNIPVEGATSSIFTPSDNGSYAVTLDKGNCSKTSACVSVGNNGLINLQLSEQVQIVPNPNKGQFMVQINDLKGLESYSIYNFDGRLVKQQHLVEDTSFDIQEELANGLYFLLLQTDEGLLMQRFIVE